MKKILLYILIVVVGVTSIASITNAQVPFIQRPVQGGTGIGTATIGDVGNCLKVSSNSPFAYTLGTCGSGGSSYFTNSGTNTYLNTGTNLQAPVLMATSTTATSTFAYDVTIANELKSKKINTVLFADRYSGANMGAKLAAATADIPAEGGIIDARGLTGSQTINTANYTLGNIDGRPITYIFGPSTINLTTGTTNIVVYDNVTIINNNTYWQPTNFGVGITNSGGFFSTTNQTTTGTIAAGTSTIVVADPTYISVGKAIAVRGMQGINPNQATTISAAMDSATTSVTVASISGLDVDTLNYFKIDNEIIGAYATSTNFYSLTRGLFGTSAASHTSGTSIYFMNAKVSRVTGVSGNSVFLEDVATQSLTSAPVLIGTKNFNFLGTATIDGRQNRNGPREGSNPSGLYSRLLSNSTFDGNITIKNFGHVGLACTGCLYNDFKGEGINSIGRPDVGFGFGILLFGQSKGNNVDFKNFYDNGKFSIAVDDRTSGADQLDGPGTFNTLHIGSIQSTSTETGGGILFSGAQHNVVYFSSISIPNDTGISLLGFQGTTPVPVSDNQFYGASIQALTSVNDNTYARNNTIYTATSTGARVTLSDTAIYEGPELTSGKFVVGASSSPYAASNIITTNTAAPAFAIDVPTGQTADIFNVAKNSVSSYFKIRSNGDVSIGTSTSIGNSALDVNSVNSYLINYFRRSGGAGGWGSTVDNPYGAGLRDVLFKVIPDTTSNVGGYGFITHNGSSGDVDSLRITGAGKVGIGTTSPYNALSVVGTTTAAVFEATTTATSTSNGGWNIATGCYAIAGVCNSGGGSGTVNSGTTGQNAYYAANGTAVSGTSTIFTSTASNVGIGSTSPYVKLGVGGSGQVDGMLTVGTPSNFTDLSNSMGGFGTSTNSYAYTYLQNKGTGPSSSVDLVFGNSNAAGVSTYYADSGFTGANWADPTFSGFSANSMYDFVTDGARHYAVGTTTASLGYFNWFTRGYTPTDEKMRLTNDGKLGIGTTSPWGTLSLSKYNTGVSTVPLFAIASSTGTAATSTQFLITPRGTVVIGTSTLTNAANFLLTNPGIVTFETYAPDTAGSRGNQWNCRGGSNGSNDPICNISFYGNDSSEIARIAVNTGASGGTGYMAFSTSNGSLSEKARIDPVGEFMIGTTTSISSSVKFHLVTSGGFNVLDSGGTSVNNTARTTFLGTAGSIQDNFAGDYIKNSQSYGNRGTNTGGTQVEFMASTTGHQFFGPLATTSPMARVTVGISSTTIPFAIIAAGSSTPAFMVSSANGNGNVGIGSALPINPLVIRSSNTLTNGAAGTGIGHLELEYNSNNAGGSAILFTRTGQSTYWSMQGQTSGGAPVFVINSDVTAASGNTAFSISNGGILSVGGATPTIQSITNKDLTIITPDNNKNIILKPNGTGSVGVGTTTPSATFAITGLTSNNPIYVSTTTATVASSTLFAVDKAGDVHYGGGTPTLSSCGTSPSLDSNSTDQVGTITVGATGTGCTVTWSTAKASAPHCQLTQRTMSLANALSITVENTTTLTFTQTGAGGNQFDYFCPLGH